VQYLMTSGGITNPSIRTALERLLGGPTTERRALVIPTAQWGHPMCGPASALDGIVGATGSGGPFGVGWASVGVLELIALPSIDPERWTAWVRDADVLLVDGGDASYLAHWMRTSGLADLLPSLPDTVWVGMSAGSMVLTPRIGTWFVEWSGATDDRALGLVDFSVFPHLDVFPTNTMEQAERWVAEVGGPAYVLDDQSAIVVDGDRVEVVSEGRWARLG
jgi:dipeptidase E